LPTLFNTFVNIVWLTGLVVQMVGVRLLCIIEFVKLFVDVDREAIEAFAGFARWLTKFDGNVSVGKVAVKHVGRFIP